MQNLCTLPTFKMAPTLKIHHCDGIHSQNDLYEEEDNHQKSYFYSITYIKEDLQLEVVQLCTFCNPLWVAANITLKQQEERKDPYYWSADLQDTLAALKDEKFKRTGILQIKRNWDED